MRLSHKNKVQSKMSHYSKNSEVVTVVKNQNSGALRCCVGIVEVAAFAVAIGSYVYARKQYKISKRTAQANRCVFKHPTTKNLCDAEIVHTYIREEDGFECIFRVCAEGHENLKKIIKSHIYKKPKND